MALEAKLVQKLSQQLLMTPQLQQAIKLLQLGRLEYLEAIQNELLENPLLEEVREGAVAENGEGGQSEGALKEANGEATGEGPNSGVEDVYAPAGSEYGEDGVSGLQTAEEVAPAAKEEPWEAYLEQFSDASGAASPRGLVDYDDLPSVEATLSTSETLSGHLLKQLRTCELPEADYPIALNVIGNLNRDGYLSSTFEEIAAAANAPLSEVERVMAVLRTLDPPGIAARNLQECLLAQLEQLGLENALEGKLIVNYLDALESRRYDRIAKAEGVTIEEVQRAVATIKTLEPKPGRPFSDETTRYVVPDVYVHKVGSDYVVTLNEDGLPRLRVSPYYMRVLRSDSPEDSSHKTYLSERLKAASWLIRSIHQRQQTIFRVAQSIVKFQRPFLDHGITKLRPLVLRDVADDISMHESTVSRVTTNKYVHTPQGVFELKFFFTTGIKTSEGDVSSSSIKERIKNLIAAEVPENPISDQAIVDILRKENIDIARRTVAKYREGLGIASSAKRKKFF